MTDYTRRQENDHSHSCGDHAASSSFTQLAPQFAVAGGVRTAIRVRQMDCPTEEALIRKKLDGMAGVNAIRFNLMQRVLTVDHAPASLVAIIDAVRSLGFTPELPDEVGS